MITNSDSNNNYSPEIEYAKIDYKKLPRRRVQPTGHSKVYFLPNPLILPEQYKVFTNARFILESVNKISSINVIDFDKSKNQFDKLKNTIIFNNWCKKIPKQYIKTTLTDNFGILFISKNTLDINEDDEILAFSTIKLMNDNRYNKSYLGSNRRYLEIDLICANSLYKHMGTQMLDVLVDIAISANCKYIHLEALDDVVEFYRKYGFTDEENPTAIKEKGVTSMDYKILSEKEYKETKKYKENYENLQEFGGSKKRTNKKRTNKKRTNKKRTSKKRKFH
jgi:hypothetical protein